jgi:glycosyltransferase involved in cell wall biosynthesis
MVRVTIITPTLNYGRFIEDTIKSVVRQNYPDLEYIIVDGGSSDETTSVVDKYKSHIATFVCEPDKGQSSAINRAILISTGEIITWLNSDDMLTDGAVRKAVQVLESHPDVDIVYSDFWDLNEQRGRLLYRKSKQIDLPELLKRNIIPQPTAFIRRRLLDRIGLVDESLHLTMDWDLWLRAARATTLLYLPNTCLAVLRDHPEAKTRALYGRRVREQLSILDRLYADPTLPSEARRSRRPSYSHVYWEAAEHATLRGRVFPDGIGWLVRSILTHPVAAAFRPLTTLIIFWSAVRSLATSAWHRRPRRRNLHAT